MLFSNKNKLLLFRRTFLVSYCLLILMTTGYGIYSGNWFSEIVYIFSLVSIFVLMNALFILGIFKWRNVKVMMSSWDGILCLINLRGFLFDWNDTYDTYAEAEKVICENRTRELEAAVLPIRKVLIEKGETWLPKTTPCLSCGKIPGDEGVKSNNEARLNIRSRSKTLVYKSSNDIFHMFLVFKCDCGEIEHPVYIPFKSHVGILMDNNNYRNAFGMELIKRSICVTTKFWNLNPDMMKRDDALLNTSPQDTGGSFLTI